MDDRPLLIGLGAPDRGDDAVGPIVAARLRRPLGPGVRVVVGCADAMTFALALENARSVVVVDALRDGDLAVGTIRRLDLAAAPTPAGARVSGHGDALGGGLRLARALGTLPRVARLVGVVGADFALGAPLSAAVAAALDDLAAAAVAALAGELPSADETRAHEDGA